MQTQLHSFGLCWDWSHTLFEKVTAVRKSAGDGIESKRSITHVILGLFQEMMFFKPIFHAYSVFPDNFFYAYNVNLDSFVIVSFFLKNITFRSITGD